MVSKSSLASEMETGEKLRIQVDKLVTEKDHLRTLLASAECKERHLFENLNRENYRSEKLSERGNTKKAAELSLLLELNSCRNSCRKKRRKDEKAEVMLKQATNSPCVVQSPFR